MADDDQVPPIHLPQHVHDGLKRLEPQLARLRRGRQDRDERKRSAWTQVADLNATPGQVLDIMEALPDPSKPRGRPQGRSYRAKDALLVAELTKRVNDGEGIGPVALELASRAEGHGTPENKADRLKRQHWDGNKAT